MQETPKKNDQLKKRTERKIRVNCVNHTKLANPKLRRVRLACMPLKPFGNNFDICFCVIVSLDLRACVNPHLKPIKFALCRPLS